MVTFGGEGGALGWVLGRTFFADCSYPGRIRGAGGVRVVTFGGEGGALGASERGGVQGPGQGPHGPVLGQEQVEIAE